MVIRIDDWRGRGTIEGSEPRPMSVLAEAGLGLQSMLSVRSSNVLPHTPPPSSQPKFRSPSDEGPGGTGDDGQLSPGVLVRCASGPPPRTPHLGPPPVTRSPHLTAHSGKGAGWGSRWAGGVSWAGEGGALGTDFPPPCLRTLTLEPNPPGPQSAPIVAPQEGKDEEKGETSCVVWMPGGG